MSVTTTEICSVCVCVLVPFCSARDAVQGLVSTNQVPDPEPGLSLRVKARDSAGGLRWAGWVQPALKTST